MEQALHIAATAPSANAASAGYRCRVLTDAAAWDEVRPWWDDLLAASPSSVTPWQGIDYLSSWWRHFGADKELRLLVVERHGKPCLALPLQVSTRFEMLGMPVRMIEPVAMIMDVNRPRLAIGPADAGAYCCAFDTLWALRRDWDMIRLDEQPAGDAVTALLRDFAQRHGLWFRDIYSHHCPWLDLRQDWDRYLASRGRHLRRNLKAARRRLESLGVVQLVDYRTPADIPAGLAQVIALHQRSWKRRKRIEQSRSLAYQHVYHDWLQSLAARDSARILVLLCNERPIAATIAVMDEHTYYSAQIVHDRAFNSVSPGTLLESLEIEALMREGRYATYDFLGGFLSNKRRWTDTAIATSLVFVMQPGLATGIVDAYYFRIKPWLKSQLRWATPVR